MNRIKKTILYLFLVHVIALLIFLLFRSILFCLMVGDIYIEAENTTFLTIQAFLMGLRFDNTISCYVMLLPLLIVGITSCLPFKKKDLDKCIYLYLCILYSICFLTAAGDIPYFQQFFKHVNASIWNWFDEPSFVLRMITQESSYIIYTILFIAIDILFCWIIRKLQKVILINDTPIPTFKWKNFGISIFFTVLLAVFCLLGIRGRVSQKSPIRIGTAYFCNDPFLNQLGLNPVYVLIRTSMDMKKNEKNIIHLMDDNKAINNVQTYLNIAVTDTIYGFPIARDINSNDTIIKKNVVVIMMEGMASHFVADTNLTPFINRLIKKSTYFPNTFSSGIHTMNAVFSTLFSYPALMNQHPFKSGDILTFNSWPVTMHKNGYSTLYFSTHDEQFDNIGGYLSANNIETITAEKDYPLSAIKSNLGVTDDFMFQFSIPILKKAANSKRNFFSVFLTASNHAPYIIPEYYNPRSYQERFQVIEFADYSLENFFNLASREAWYNNTIFVLIGDHGASNNDYDVSLAYHHIPLIIFDPSDETPHVYNNIAGQIDVFPTIMGKLGLPYTNNTFGVDLMKEKREMIFFSSDDAYCCLDSAYYFVHRDQGAESLYLYKSNGKEDVIATHPEKANEMRKYVQSMMQTAQYIIINKKVFVTQKERNYK